MMPHASPALFYFQAPETRSRAGWMLRSWRRGSWRPCASGGATSSWRSCMSAGRCACVPICSSICRGASVMSMCSHQLLPNVHLLGVPTASRFHDCDADNKLMQHNGKIMSSQRLLCSKGFSISPGACIGKQSGASKAQSQRLCRAASRARCSRRCARSWPRSWRRWQVTRALGASCRPRPGALPRGPGSGFAPSALHSASVVYKGRAHSMRSELLRTAPGLPEA